MASVNREYLHPLVRALSFPYTPPMAGDIRNLTTGAVSKRIRESTRTEC